MEQRYEVWVDYDLFWVYDTKDEMYVGKGYKYSRYAFNLQGKLEMENN